jgi:NADPH:quinone reductase-like Zn-dependent oxidoreductase
MKVIVCQKYGSPDVLQLCDVENPIPLDNEVLIRTYAASINSRDLRMLRAKPVFIRLMPGGLFHPKNKILGGDLAGQVEAIGRNVKQFKPGDEVFGFLPSATGKGTFAEFVCATEELLAPKPANLTFEQAAAVPLAAMTSLQGLRAKGNIQPGLKVLIQGASGGVGTFAVQIAKAFGAEVTAVCSTRNLDMARSLGADHVIDYLNEDFCNSGQLYDLILVVNGYHPLSDYQRVLQPDGTLAVCGGSLITLLQAARNAKRNVVSGGQNVSVVSLKQNQNDLFRIKELLESEKIKPVIDGSYPFEKTSEAFRYFEKEHPRGKVVITMI